MANKKDEKKDAIQAVIKQMMDRVMQRVMVEDPFDAHVHRDAKPLYAALVPDEIFKGAHFERRFVTPFGMAWQNLAVVAAKYGLGEAVTERVIRGTVKSERLRRIAEVLNWLEHSAKGEKKRKPDWDAEMDYILAGSGKDTPIAVTCDVYAEDTKRGQRFSFEIKAPLPNSDITKVSKEKILKLWCMDPPQIDGAYFALPYNPFGQREFYKWSFPMRWFNMREDSVVLIGDEFWEKIGGKGTYQAFIQAVNEIGVHYRERIYREFLGIEPPQNDNDWKLPI